MDPLTAHVAVLANAILVLVALATALAAAALLLARALNHLRSRLPRCRPGCPATEPPPAQAPSSPAVNLPHAQSHWPSAPLTRPPALSAIAARRRPNPAAGARAPPG